MKKYFVYGLVVILLAAVGSLLWLSRDATPMVTVAASSTGVTPLSGGSVPAVAAPTGVEMLPDSQPDIQGDDGLEVDANGHLKITVALRKVFDYYLSASDKIPVNIIAMRIRAYLKHRLKDPAEGEAEHILDGYINYTQALATIHASSPASLQTSGAIDAVALKTQMEQDAALRSQFLSPEVIQAFFGDEDAYKRFSIARILIMQNQSLSDAQRVQQLAALQRQLLQSSLPGSMTTANKLLNLQNIADDCKQRSCSPAELQQMRANLVGPEEAAQMAAADQQKAAWDQRMNNYLSQRDNILGNPGLSDQDKQQQVKALRNSQFNDTEQVRVAVLENRHDRSAAP